MNIQKTINEEAEVILTGTIAKSDVATFWDRAVKEIQKEVSVPGFRKGHVPHDRLIQEVGENFLWRTAADIALREKINDIVKEHDISPIAPLNMSIQNAKKDEDVAFEITAITPPSCEIGDYKKIAEEALTTVDIDDSKKEKEAAIRAFRTQVRTLSLMKNPEEVKEGDAKINEEKADTMLSDEEAKIAGFENGKAIEHFIDGEADKAIKDRLLQKKRGAVAEALIQKAQVRIPKLIIDDETRSLVHLFKQDVQNQGLEWSDYLKRIKKDEEGVRADLEPQAKKRITLDLVFAEIIQKESILLEEHGTKEEEMVRALTAQGAPEERARHYIREQLLREKVWEVLGVKSESAV